MAYRNSLDYNLGIKSMIRKLLLIYLSIFNMQAVADNISNSQLDMIPAHILNSVAHEKSLVNNIEFPQGEDDMKLFIRCETYITKRGGFMHPYCYELDDKNDVYIKNTFKGMSKSQAIPAIIRGEKTRIWTPFSILFKRKGGNEKIIILSNHLNNVNEYGYYYMSPQRYKKRSRAHCGSLQLLKPTLFIQKISENGTVESVEHQGGRCTEVTARTFEDAMYIPAQVNQKFVQGTITEYIFPNARKILH